tara:strand:+ start:453 stop:593 length:141 start_codon:yes stop_codon:yes gene_type:complete
VEAEFKKYLIVIVLVSFEMDAPLNEYIPQEMVKLMNKKVLIKFFIL